MIIHFEIYDEILSKDSNLAKRTKHKIIKELEDLSREVKTYLIVDGISKEFSFFANNVASSFDFCIVLSPVIDVLHSNKIGIHRGTIVPEAWDEKSFKLIKLGIENSVFSLLPFNKRLIRILVSYVRFVYQKYSKKKKLRVLLSLGKFPDKCLERSILLNLNESVHFFNALTLQVYQRGKYENVKDMQSDSQLHFELHDAQDFNPFSLRKFRWDFAIVNSGQTFLECVSLGVFSFTIPNHEFQHDFVRSINSPMIKLVNSSTITKMDFLASWMDSLNYISWHDYTQQLIRFKDVSLSRLWADIVRQFENDA